MGANHIKDTIAQDKTINETTFVAHCRDCQVFALSNALAHNISNLIADGGSGKANQKHLEHVYVAVLVVNIIEAFNA